MASFNEGGLDEVKAEVQVTAPSAAAGSSSTATTTATAGSSATARGFDTSTSAFLFDLAIEKNDDPGFKHAVLQRHEHFHIGGLHPHPTFSLRFGSVNDDVSTEDEQPARLWAQRHVMAKQPYYVISTSPLDMDASKQGRSQFYLGKLKESHGARSFTGKLAAIAILWINCKCIAISM
jgi:hypothetical protein